ncbi:hypothetical protein [Nitrosomonas sp. Nm84]|uniref:hypothetical protein n=1 Tax=Nitrosomonas sp. Nm84 TaxID=200124 RepID=UPI0015E893B3|nr:hypothetical protein [Nitrosomonas sp. Nm84]
MTGYTMWIGRRRAVQAGIFPPVSRRLPSMCSDLRLSRAPYGGSRRGHGPELLSRTRIPKTPFLSFQSFEITTYSLSVKS